MRCLLSRPLAGPCRIALVTGSTRKQGALIQGSRIPSASIQPPGGRTTKTDSDGARLFGNVVGPASIAAGMRLPAAVSTMGRIGTGALGGGIGGLMTPVSDTEGDVGFAAQKTGQAGVGALGGAVASPLLGKIADVVAPPLKALATRMFSDPAKLASRAAIEASDAVDSVVKQLGVDRASIPQQVYQEIRQQVADSFKKGEKIDASALLRKKDFDALGVPALRGQITRDPAQYSRDMNVRGIEGAGEPVANLLSAQNQKITSKLGGFGGTKAREAVPAGDMFTGALKALDDKLSESVRRAYQNARASSGKDWDVPLGGLANDVANVVDTFGIGAEKNAVPSAIASKLKSFGIINDPGMTPAQGLQLRRGRQAAEADQRPRRRRERIYWRAPLSSKDGVV